MTAAQPRWEFHYAEDETWAWRRPDVGAFSNSHKSLGAAMTDAFAHGFNPSTHAWVIEDRLSVTRFAPGESPQTLGK